MKRIATCAVIRGKGERLAIFDNELDKQIESMKEENRQTLKLLMPQAYRDRTPEEEAQRIKTFNEHCAEYEEWLRDMQLSPIIRVLLKLGVIEPVETQHRKAGKKSDRVLPVRARILQKASFAMLLICEALALGYFGAAGLLLVNAAAGVAVICGLISEEEERRLDARERDEAEQAGGA